MRSRIFFKLITSFLVVIAAAVLTIDYAAARAWQKSLRSEIENSMREKTAMFAARVHDVDAPDVRAVAAQTEQLSGARATVIKSDGTVLADSEADPAHMENHATRPEFREALAGRMGMSVRHSHTIGVDFLYVAAPIAGGGVRLAYPLRSIDEAMRSVRFAVLRSSILAFLVAVLISAIAAQIVSRRLQRIVAFAEEIARGNLSARLRENSTDEIGRVAASLDATARKLDESFRAIDESHRELDSVLNSMQEAVLAVGADGRVQWANQRLDRMLPNGVRRGQPAVESVRDPEVLRVLEEAAKSRNATTARASSVVPGKVFTVTASPMPGGGAVAVLHDLTDIERVEKTRRDFIANVSHELRTPLTSIQGYAETLLDAPADQSREFVDIIRKNALRMTRLTEDLLVLAKVESGEQKLNLEATPVAEILESAAQYARETYPEITVQCNASSTATVNVDRDAVFQVFANFIDNAARYAGEGRRIELNARDRDNSVIFSVRDYGPGIVSEHLPRLFERFYRVDKARSRESGGTGLGLAIAKHIVLAHGGAIWAESELGRGSEFCFQLAAR